MDHMQEDRACMRRRVGRRMTVRAVMRQRRMPTPPLSSVPCGRPRSFRRLVLFVFVSFCLP